MCLVYQWDKFASSMLAMLALVAISPSFVFCQLIPLKSLNAKVDVSNKVISELHVKITAVSRVTCELTSVCIWNELLF